MRKGKSQAMWMAVVCLAAAQAMFLAGCSRESGTTGGGTQAGPDTSGAAPKTAPVFSLAWSEYPSWSVFGVAHKYQLIDGAKGKLGPIEKKWKVDIELKEADYDTCIVMYGAGKCDAACLTNMDVLNPSLRRQSVGVLPTSTSFGADALIVPEDIKDIKQLRDKNIYGLKKTVSEYCFVRNLEILGEKEADYKFTNMDPGAAALAMQQKKEGYDAIVVWNPFVLETLNKRSDLHVLFDSTAIPGEIVDMVQVAQESLDRDGGKAFACAVIDAFYAVNRRLADAKTRDETLVAIGEKFANLPLKSMKKVVEQTQFYATPEDGLKLFTGPEFKAINDRVADFCLSHEIVPSAPRIGYGGKDEAPDAQWRVDPTYIRECQAEFPVK